VESVICFAEWLCYSIMSALSLSTNAFSSTVQFILMSGLLPACLPLSRLLPPIPSSPTTPSILAHHIFQTKVIHKLTMSYHFVCILYHAARDYSTQMGPRLEHKEFFSLLWPPILLGTSDPIPNTIINCTANTSSRIVCKGYAPYFYVSILLRSI
jgi:hypothetical protein